VDLKVPQNADPNGLGTPPLKDVTVALPSQLVVSPSSADGLEGCADSQINLSSASYGNCPLGSKLGDIIVRTPVLPNPLEGAVFLAAPECDPCTEGNHDAASGRMIRLFIEAEGSGVVLKLEGRVVLDEQTGQLTASFKNNPQQPFEDLKLEFKDGPRAALATPASCGTYSSLASLSAWSSPFTQTSNLAAPFDVSSCTSGGIFSPLFAAGTTNNQAARFTPFTFVFSRTDVDRQFASVSASLPPGLLAKLAGVPLCSDPDAVAGTCPVASQVGTVATRSGPGSHPLTLPGQVYLTGPYMGGPYGLAVEVPAIAGPFTLGTVVVRQSLSVDPHDAHVTVHSDPFPTILDGIPLQIRSVNVTIDRPGGFTVNPTSCAPMQVRATLSSTSGDNRPVQSPFQVAGCASLPFKPTFTASTQSKTSKTNGASLDVKLTQGPSEANIHRAQVQLPLSLPSRLTTLQKACTEAQFASNPAGCPAAANVGHATARTPLLDVPLTGPAYLVSHGGAAFPDLVVVLQGAGITVNLVGNTNIRKGITFSRFEAVPDAPISAFQLTLPQGPNSLLAANGSLCASSPLMPTTLVGQNGAQISRSTTITVTGCGRPSVKILRDKVRGGNVTIRLSCTQAGQLSVTGRGVRSTKRTLAAGVRTVNIALRRTGAPSRRRLRKVRLHLALKSDHGSVRKVLAIRR
jgi:hypothetical protein